MQTRLPVFFAILMNFYLSASLAKPIILVLGDSLSAAYQIPPEQGWVNLLEKKIYAIHPAASVINSSIVGDTTANGLQRLPALLAEHRPNIVILELGGNDGLRGLPIQRIRDNLQQIITLCQQIQAKVLLIGLRLPPNYGPIYTQEFEYSYVQLSKKNQIPLVPFILDKIALDPQLMLADRIHPSAEAQVIILKNIWPHLEPLLAP